MSFALILLPAVLLDFIFGDPRYLPHPVIFIGRAILFLQHKFKNHNFKNGLALCVIIIFFTSAITYLILYVFKFHAIAQIVIIYFALAWQDLKDETIKIFYSLESNNIDEARKYLSYVVGRDTENLSVSEISCATVETIAENSIDGVISIIFYAWLGYLLNQNFGACVLVWIFKAASTMDSMIGYEHFGKFGTPAAKLDDVLNFIPARIGGLIIILAGGFKICALKIFLRDRLKHKSPNSAHGESAFGGVLNLKLGGGAFYDKIFEEREFIGGENFARPLDIIRAINLLDRACAIFCVIVMIGAEYL